MAAPTIKNRLFTVLKVSRVPGWTFGPILFGIGVIHSRVLPKSRSSLLRAGVQVFALSYPLCAIVFGVNDVYDYASDVRNPRKIADGLEGSVLHPIYHQDVLRVAYASSAFIVASALLTGTTSNIGATLLLVLLSWQYSSPPLRLKEVPIADSLSNGAIVFLAWFIGFSFSGLSIREAPRKGYMLSLCTAGVHALGAVMDVEADRTSGQRTIATVLGRRPAAIFAALCYLAASTTVAAKSLFGVYVWTGLAIMLVPCIEIAWAHPAFLVIVYWSLASSVIWIGVHIWRFAKVKTA